MRPRTVPMWLLSALLLVAPAGAADEPAGAAAEEAAPEDAEVAATPTGRVEGFHETLLSVMKEAKSLGVQGRYQELEPAVTDFFHLPLMIRIASGSAWTQGTDEQRDRLARSFERMSVATYADRFDGYSGESFATDGTKPGPQGTTLVESRIVRPDKDDVTLVYVMREVDGRWRAVDVLLDTGISELARYRSEYRKSLKDGGIDRLVAELDSKVSDILGDEVAGRR